VTGVDYSLLMANSDVLNAMRAACVGFVADAAGVPTSSVAVEFSQGSVVVRASITVPQDQTAADVSGWTTAGWMADSLAGQVNSISGIDAVTNGDPIGVVGMSVVEGGIVDEVGSVSSGTGGARHLLCPLAASSLIVFVCRSCM